MMKRISIVLFSFGLLSACSMVPDSLGTGGSNTAPSQSGSQPQMQTPPVAVSGAARQCLTQLGEAGVQFTALPDQYTGQGCSTVGTVQMSALRSDSSLMSLGNIGPVKCALSGAFAAWARFGVDRAARQILGSPLQRIETFGSYACRNVAGSSRRSAHSTAGAIDISGFVLEDGRRINVAQDWSGGSAAEQEFLRVIQRSACRRFDTVLGPEYNAAHRDHFHLEGVIDGNSFCR